MARLGSVPCEERDLAGLDLLTLVEEGGEGTGDRGDVAADLGEGFGRDENQTGVCLPGGPVAGVELNDVIRGS